MQWLPKLLQNTIRYFSNIAAPADANWTLCRRQVTKTQSIVVNLTRFGIVFCFIVIVQLTDQFALKMFFYFNRIG